MRTRKYPLKKDRIRQPPPEGWSWIDRRFLREKASRLERDAIFLYFFLAAVSDRDGLSYWGDPSIGRVLRMTEAAVARAREALEREDLIAYQAPLYQVLSIPGPLLQRREASSSDLLGDILGKCAGGSLPPHQHRGEKP